MQKALKHLRAMLQCQRASVGIFDVERKEVRVFVANVDGESIVETGTVLAEDMYGDLEILKTGKTEVVEDMSGLQSPPVVARLLRVEGIQSSINVPLLSAHGLYGALNIGWDTVRRILPEEMEIVGEVARQVTIAFQQATLMQETKRYASELEQRVLVRTAELEDANRELEAFTYSVSHDLRAPLRAVDGFTRVLLEDYGSMLDVEGQRVCAIISTSARNMGRLIDDLLAFSRIGRAALQPSAFDMAAAIRGILLELISEEARERIEVAIGALPVAVGDSSLLRQVWVNLISNAIKFTSRRERASITISGLTTGEEVVYSIRDNGAGFDMKYADKLFGVFQRLHSAKEFEGTGVGLAIVQRIVHRHGGRVWAVGETGNGATFSFSIPTGLTPWTASTS
ncbi:MAG: GAF domain-containing protein [Ignavibacteria bacterium]|nr:GAF domain-containing protein [Ignavibacteria bacterium]